MTSMTPESTQALAAISLERRTPGQRFSWLRQYLRNPVGVAATVFLLVVIIACYAAPLLTPYDPLQNDLSHILELPSPAHWLGTDEVGRDVLSRLMYGGQASLIGVFIAIATALVIGVPIGIAAGYFGGALDGIFGRVVDVMLAIPGILVLLLVLAVFGQNLNVAMFTLGILFSPNLIRVTRAATLVSREELYVSAARVSGLSNFQILLRHIFPRIANPVMVNVALLASSALLVQTGLNFLGMGVTLPHPSWGGMVAEGGSALRQQPWLIIPSGLTIALTVLAFVLIGDAVRDATQNVRSSTEKNLHRSKRTHQWLVPADLDSRSQQESPLSTSLSVRDLSISLPLRDGWTTVVDRVSFDVQKGETVGLVGESGCGKTVTALSILGVVPGAGRISTGEIWYEGTNLAALSPRAMARYRGGQIAYISQEPMSSLDPSFTVGGQLVEAIRQHKRISRRAARERAIQLLDMTGIRNPTEVAKRFPHQISGGMAQRVVIARALAGDPTLLIADEPTTALDSTVQREILVVLRRIQRLTGMSIVLVTHDWGVVAEMCDRAVVMYAGQTVEEAKTEPIFHQPLHPYTDRLLKANPHLAEEGDTIATIDGTVPGPVAWPQGCRFATRCPIAQDDCRVGPVPLVLAEEDHRSRCIHIDELLKVNA